WRSRRLYSGRWSCWRERDGLRGVSINTRTDEAAKSPQVRGERWCHGHAKMMSYRPEKLEILPMEDEQAVMVNLYRVTNSLLAGRISEKTAALLLWSAAMVAPGLRKSRVIARNRNVIARNREGKSKTYHGDTEARRKTRKNSPQMQIKTLPLMNTDGTDPKRVKKQDREHYSPGGPCRYVKSARASHSGVTHDKSFKSGMETGRTPRIAEIARDRNVIARIHGCAGTGRKGKSKTYHGVTETRRKTGNPVNMSVDGKRRVVDNSGQAGAATQQQGLMKADGMPARPFCAL